MAIAAQDFCYIKDLMYQRAGIFLEAGKEYLVEARLESIARQNSLLSVSALVYKLRTQPYGILHNQVIEAMTTNETFFFRDTLPFEKLKHDIFPKLFELRKKERQLNIWSAAASSGQEPYSTAMILRDFGKMIDTWSVHILATDISTQVLKKAREGRYNQLEINRGINMPSLLKYFTKDGIDWKVKQEIRQMIHFQQLNLIDNWPSFPLQDVILLRNVLIYFDLPTKKAILEKIAKQLRPDGYLILGSSESVSDLTKLFKRVQFDRMICFQLI